MSKSLNILVTGSSGMLGRGIRSISHSMPHNIIFTSRDDLDVTNYENFANLHHRNIDVIFHCAAKVNADFCERNRDVAKKIFIDGTNNVINFAESIGAKIIYPQSFLIFSSDENKITEKTLPNPNSYYGELKLSCENQIIKSNKENLIVRMGGFFGGEEKDKNFVGKIIPNIIQAIKDNKKSIQIGDRVWQPTYANDLAYNSIKLAENMKSGVYNMSSIDSASFYELTCEILKILDLDSIIEAKKVSASIVESNEDAKRPKNVILDLKKLSEENLNFQRSWKISLHEYLNQDYFKNLVSTVRLKNAPR